MIQAIWQGAANETEAESEKKNQAALVKPWFQLAALYFHRRKATASRDLSLGVCTLLLLYLPTCELCLSERNRNLPLFASPVVIKRHIIIRKVFLKFQNMILLIVSTLFSYRKIISCVPKPLSWVLSWKVHCLLYWHLVYVGTSLYKMN